MAEKIIGSTQEVNFWPAQSFKWPDKWPNWRKMMNCWRFFALVLAFFSQIYAADIPTNLWGGVLWGKEEQKGYFAECSKWSTENGEGLCKEVNIFQFEGDLSTAQSFQFKSISLIHKRSISLSEMEAWWPSFSRNIQSALKILLARNHRGLITVNKTLKVKVSTLKNLFDYSLWPGEYQVQSPLRPATLKVFENGVISFRFHHECLWQMRGGDQYLHSHISLELNSVGIEGASGLTLPAQIFPLGAYLASIGRGQLILAPTENGKLGILHLTVRGMVLKDVSSITLERIE